MRPNRWLTVAALALAPAVEARLTNLPLRSTQEPIPQAFDERTNGAKRLTFTRT